MCIKCVQSAKLRYIERHTRATQVIGVRLVPNRWRLKVYCDGSAPDEARLGAGVGPIAPPPALLLASGRSGCVTAGARVLVFAAAAGCASAAAVALLALLLLCGAPGAGTGTGPLALSGLCAGCPAAEDAADPAASAERTSRRERAGATVGQPAGGGPVVELPLAQTPSCTHVESVIAESATATASAHSSRSHRNRST